MRPRPCAFLLLVGAFRTARISRKDRVELRRESIVEIVEKDLAGSYPEWFERFEKPYGPQPLTFTCTSLLRSESS
jgi:hypothetical protein